MGHELHDRFYFDNTPKIKQKAMISTLPLALAIANEMP